MPIQPTPAATPATIDPADNAKPAESDADKAKAEAASAAAEAAHPSKGLFVLYLGPRNATIAADELKKRQPKVGEGTVAEISVAQWSQAGVESKRAHTWNLANNWKIPATQFSQEQIDYLLTNSKRFQLVDGEGEKVDH